MAETIPVCPHCGQAMKKWESPPDSSWDSPFQFVCFNDECPYYVNGWDHMWSNYQQKASYRHRTDPTTGDSGPLPVWSNTALRDGIIVEK